MKKYLFAVSLQIPGMASFAKGDVVDANAIPSNYLESWLRNGFIVEHTDPPPPESPGEVNPG